MLNKYLKLETLRNSRVGDEAVSLNYYSRNVGSELDTHYTIADYTIAEELEITETVNVIYAQMFGREVDRRLHTEEIEAVVDSTGTLWVEAEYFYNNL